MSGAVDAQTAEQADLAPVAAPDRSVTARRGEEATQAPAEAQNGAESVVVPTAQQAELDPRAYLPPVGRKIERQIIGCVFGGGIGGPALAALAILGIDEIDAGLKALHTLAHLAAQHQWQHAPDSTWQSCTCGVLGCRVPDVLEEGA